MARSTAGGFDAFSDIPGITAYSTFFAPINNLMDGTMTIDDYAELIRTNSAMMAAARFN